MKSITRRGIYQWYPLHKDDGGLLAEIYFKERIDLERKRGERSNKSFLLSPISIKNARNITSNGFVWQIRWSFGRAGHLDG